MCNSVTNGMRNQSSWFEWFLLGTLWQPSFKYQPAFACLMLDILSGDHKWVSPLWWQHHYDFFSFGSRRFMENMQTEVLQMEFNEFSQGMRTISEVDFARILLRYTILTPEETDEYLERMRQRIPESKVRAASVSLLHVWLRCDSLALTALPVTIWEVLRKSHRRLLPLIRPQCQLGWGNPSINLWELSNCLLFESANTSLG